MKQMREIKRDFKAIINAKSKNCPNKYKDKLINIKYYMSIKIVHFYFLI